MLEDQARQSNLYVLAGLAMHFIGGFLVAQEDILFVGALFLLIGSMSFLWGCCCYAKGKGYPALVGLLGLFWLLGLIVLVILPDRKW